MPKRARRKQGKLIVISGPSGVGKGALVGKVLERVPDVFLSVSATTRKPRPGEADRVHYSFLPKETFESWIRRGEFLEWARVYGDFYGTPKAPIVRALDDGKLVILEIDVQGAQQVKETLGTGATYIFISPPSIEELKRRLAGRKTETGPEQQKRAGIALRELELAGDYDYVVINDNLDTAADELIGILKKVGGGNVPEYR